MGRGVVRVGARFWGDEAALAVAADGFDFVALCFSKLDFISMSFFVSFCFGKVIATTSMFALFEGS